MVRAFADSVSTALWSRTQTFQHWSAVNENRCDIKLTVFRLTLIFLFPIGDCRTKQFLNLRSSFLIENFNIPKALNTSIPRTMSATRRILRGEEGTLRSVAQYKVFRASLIFSAEFLFLTPIVFNSFLIQISSYPSLFLLVACVSTEDTCRGELAQLVSNHVLSHVNRDKFVSIMHSKRVAYKVRCNH